MSLICNGTSHEHIQLIFVGKKSVAVANFQLWNSPKSIRTLLFCETHVTKSLKFFVDLLTSSKREQQQQQQQQEKNCFGINVWINQ